MAVDELLDEHEQGERVREWIRQNAIGIVGGIAIALALVYAWGKWQDHLGAKRIEQGEAYASLEAAIAAGEYDQARARAAEAGLDQGVYATLLAMDIAAAQVRAGEGEAAIGTLSGIADPDPALSAIINRRLAMLLVDAGRTDEALAAIGDARDAGSLEMRGDAERVAGRMEQAREAYASALAALDEADVPRRTLLGIKLIDAGGSPEQNEAQAR